VASHVFGPSTTQVDPDLPDRESRQTTNWHHTEDPTSSFQLHQLVVRAVRESYQTSRVLNFGPQTTERTGLKAWTHITARV